MPYSYAYGRSHFVEESPAGAGCERLESAVKAIAELEAIRLTAADSLAFAEALLNPRAPDPELRVAAERYRKRVGRGSDRESAVSDRST